MSQCAAGLNDGGPLAGERISNLGDQYSEDIHQEEIRHLSGSLDLGGRFVLGLVLVMGQHLRESAARWSLDGAGAVRS